MDTLRVALSKVFCRHRGSNPRPLYLESNALPMSYTHCEALQHVVMYGLVSMNWPHISLWWLPFTPDLSLYLYPGILCWTTLTQPYSWTQTPFNFSYTYNCFTIEKLNWESAQNYSRNDGKWHLLPIVGGHCESGQKCKIVTIICKIWGNDRDIVCPLFYVNQYSQHVSE